ncbi:hypothetical protein GGI13_004221 [Coemansia sp. RSA 455]|nr:hypothetical protein GGI13_004221 [Coemansia sp. RSA 455]
MDRGTDCRGNQRELQRPLHRLVVHIHGRGRAHAARNNVEHHSGCLSIHIKRGHSLNQRAKVRNGQPTVSQVTAGYLAQQQLTHHALSIIRAAGLCIGSGCAYQHQTLQHLGLAWPHAALRRPNELGQRHVGQRGQRLTSLVSSGLRTSRALENPREIRNSSSALYAARPTVVAEERQRQSQQLTDMALNQLSSRAKRVLAPRTPERLTSKLIRIPAPKHYKRRRCPSTVVLAQALWTPHRQLLKHQAAHAAQILVVFVHVCFLHVLQ